MLKLLKKYNTHLILLSVALTFVIGPLAPSLFDKIQFLGELFINLLKVFALPLICSALIAALGGMDSSLSNLKSLARNTVGYMLTSEIIAVTIALALFNIFNPGVGLSRDLVLHGQAYVANNEGVLKISSFILSIFPHNFFESLAKFELLPVVVFSILFGLGCSFSGSRPNPVVQLAQSARDACTACLNGVMLFAPVGIFSLVGSGIAQASLSGSLQESFVALLKFVLVLFAGLLLHGTWQLLLVCFLTKQSLFKVLKQSLPVFATAFGTSSSVATLPVAIRTADLLKSQPTVTRFMLPLCASINIGGMMLYEVAATLFFSQVLGLNLSVYQQALVALACILGGMAEGGIPETSLVSLVVVFRIANIPLSAISLLLPLDRIIDRVRTMVNIFGNMCGAIVVSHITPTQADVAPETQTIESLEMTGYRES